MVPNSERNLGIPRAIFPRQTVSPREKGHGARVEIFSSSVADESRPLDRHDIAVIVGRQLDKVNGEAARRPLPKVQAPPLRKP